MKGCCADSNVLKPAELNRRITLQHLTKTKDEIGNEIKVWTDLVTLGANRKPLSGREWFGAVAVNAEKMVKYRIRYRRGIVPSMRLIDRQDGMTYEIKAVLDDYYGDRTQTHIMAEVMQSG